ncbi:MAG: formylmethanofuran dehydrogenase subunit B [Geminicoccaceae bacterium]
MDEQPATVIQEVVCPFCSMGCDDLEVALADGALRLVGPDCPVAAEGFGRGQPAVEPALGGKPAALEAALAEAARLLRASSLPLLGGLGTDVAGMREVLALAERVGGIVDHAGSRGLLANVRAMQDGGTVTATLAEIRNRADLVLVVATDVTAIAPRFVERCLAPTATLFGSLERQLVHLGPGQPLAGAERLACPPEQLGEIVAVLRALAAGTRIAATGPVGGLAVAALGELADRLRAARYPIIVWAARDLTGSHPDLLTAALAGLIRELNAKGRCSGVPLAGPDNIVGANQVCGWQTGGPLRTSFAGGVPDHDPVRWSIPALLRAGATDCLVWISSFGTLPLPDRSVPTIALVRPGHPLPPDVEVAIPVGTPGLDHAGSAYRMDGVVSLPLGRLRPTDLPSVAQVLARIGTLLEAS